MAELRIYKYTLPRDFGESALSLPVGARVLSTGWQGHPHDELQVWALVDPEEQKEQVAVCALPTGFEALPERKFPWHFVGTAEAKNGIVVHVFVQWSPRYGHPLPSKVHHG